MVSSKQYCGFPCTSQSDYLYYNQTCRSTCDNPLSPRSEGGRLYCDYNCGNTEFLFWNKSCISNCPSYLYSFTWSSKNFCVFPCQNDDYFLYWNTSCLLSCPSPLHYRNESTKQYCDYPCLGTDWLYWDGLCRDNCSFPLSPQTTAGNRFCSFPCANNLTLYWNGSCLSGCSSPLTNRTFVNYNFCDFPCLSIEYVYWNKACYKTCDFPLIAKNLSGSFFCGFPCKMDEYSYWNGSCAKSCDFPLVSTYENDAYFCNFPCTSKQYLYPDGSCSFTCFAPLIGTTIGSNFYCNSPCNSTAFVYWNSKCYMDCPSPLLNQNNYIKKCYTPCSSPSVYIFPNGSCTTACNAPRSISSHHEHEFCIYPCTDNTIKAFTGSCLNSCDYPYVLDVIKGDKYCKAPCDARQYFHAKNGTCMSYCTSPYIEVELQSIDQCIHPCSGDKNLYLYENGSCLASCNFPYFPYLKLEDVYTCVYECNSPFVEINKVCQCPKGYILSSDTTTCDISGAVGKLVSSLNGNSGASASFLTVILILGANPLIMFTLIHLLQTFFYLTFINVDYPIIVTKFLQMFDIANLSFLPNPFSYLLGKSSTSSSSASLRVSSDRVPDPGSDLPSPDKFFYNHFSGYFLQSAGSIFGMLVFFIAIYFILRIANNYIDEESRVYAFIEKMKKALEWSGLIRLWTLFYLKFCMASLLQIRVINFTEERFALSSLIAIFVVLINSALPLISIFVVSREKGSVFKEKFRIFFEDFNPNDPIKKYFTFFVFLKKFIFCFSLVFAYYFPAIQNLIPWSLFLCSGIAYVTMRPHLRRRNNILNAYVEIGFLILHSMVMIFIFNDLEVISLSYDTKEFLGLIFVLCCLVVLVIKILIIVVFGFTESFAKLKQIWNNPVMKRTKKVDLKIKLDTVSYSQRRRGFVVKKTVVDKDF